MFALQDFLKYSKKASLDTSELEVLTPAGPPDSPPGCPHGSPKQPVAGGVCPGRGGGSGCWRVSAPGCALCTLEDGRARAGTESCADRWLRSLPQRAVEVMCVVPKRCNDMMNVGRLQGFDVMRL